MEVEVSGKCVLVDDNDAHLIIPGRWRIDSKGYVIRQFRAEGKRGFELLHRTIAYAVDDQIVDHINGDTLDNRRANLRICTHSENMMNRRVHKNNTSGFKGVYRRRSGWAAQIKAAGKKYCLGIFPTAELAGAAYAAAAIRLHGEFSRAN